MIKRILVPIDFSDVTDTLIMETVELAMALKASVCLLHVEATPDFVSYSPGPQYKRDNMPKEASKDYHHLNNLKTNFKTRGLEVKAVILQGDTVEKILQESIQFGTDLIMMGSHGHGALYHLLLGSVSEGILHKASCPVMIIPSQKRESKAP